MQHNSIIFENLFNRSFTSGDNVRFLKELTDKHPYFSPAQFFLLQHTSENTASFDSQAVKTNIFFNNPHWLNFQIRQTKPVEVNVHTNNYPEINSTEKERAAIDDLPDNTEVPDGDSYPMEKEIETMRFELKIPEAKTNLDEAMLFEPMHVVDYFASQGIKLTDQLQPGDKLGKQLKSFTEWLKTMKKVHTGEEPELAAHSDTNIQALAENSNAETEVLTESMAEVFARQGKPGKATEVYQKLSLLNPDKSTYFAAKLENLKGI
jgi:hypothetical protein